MPVEAGRDWPALQMLDIGRGSRRTGVRTMPGRAPEGQAKRSAAWKILAPDWSGRLPVTRRNGGNVQSSRAGSATKK